MKSPQASAASVTWWWTGPTKQRASPTSHPKVWAEAAVLGWDGLPMTLAEPRMCSCFAGYAFLLFQEESSVQALIEACMEEDGKLYLCVSSPTIKDKPVSWLAPPLRSCFGLTETEWIYLFLWLQVQIRPWNLSDSDFVMDGSQPLDPRKTIFVGGVPRPLRASTCSSSAPPRASSHRLYFRFRRLGSIKLRKYRGDRGKVGFFFTIYCTSSETFIKSLIVKLNDLSLISFNFDDLGLQGYGILIYCEMFVYLLGFFFAVGHND